MHDLSFIYPQWEAPWHIKALSTTRLGGVSQQRYASLNLGAHVADEPEHVQRNRQRLVSQAGLAGEPIWLNQTHGTRVVELKTHNYNHDCASDNSLINADGAFTSQPGLVCAVLTADCMPILLTDRAGSQVAAIHAGWRGLADGILENAISKFNASAEQIMAWVGPCISADVFEIGYEVRAQLGGPDSAYKRAGANGDKLYADLVALAQLRLAKLGVNLFCATNQCTYLEQDHFFSYRRDGQCGRMATLIWIE